jgi:hypothetical protein
LLALFERRPRAISRTFCEEVRGCYSNLVVEIASLATACPTYSGVIIHLGSDTHFGKYFAAYPWTFPHPDRKLLA